MTILKSTTIRGHATMAALCFATLRFDLAMLWIDSLVADSPYGESA